MTEKIIIDSVGKGVKRLRKSPTAPQRVGCAWFHTFFGTALGICYNLSAGTIYR